MPLSAAETVDLVPLFESLGKRERRKLASGLNERRYSAGDALSSEHDGGIGFFLVAEGSATVTVNGNPRRTLGPGDYFGEMALIDDFPRSADALAHEACRLFVLNKDRVADLLFVDRDLAYDLLWTFVRTLSARLRETNDKMTFLAVSSRF